jgi:hypothetical protein
MNISYWRYWIKQDMVSLQISSKENTFCRTAEPISIGFYNDAVILWETSWEKNKKGIYRNVFAYSLRDPISRKLN